jgi:molecular chaperone GrpE (heat shock protein)
MADITREEMRERLGNIDQIRDLLFGHKVREYEQQFESSDRRLEKLEAELSNFQVEMRDQIERLQESLATEIRSGLDSLEKKLKYLSLTTHEQTSKLQEEITLTDRKLSHGVESLLKDVKSQTSLFKEDLAQTKTKIAADFQDLKERVTEEVEQVFSNLKETKVSRADLADVLFEVCLKIKGTEFVPSLKEATENQMKTDFVLPEQAEETDILPNIELH